MDTTRRWQFSIRDVLLLMLIVGLGVGWLVDHARLADEVAAMRQSIVLQPTPVSPYSTALPPPTSGYQTVPPSPYIPNALPADQPLSYIPNALPPGEIYIPNALGPNGSPFAPRSFK